MKSIELTHSNVRNLFDYNKNTGILTNKVNRGGTSKAGDKVGFKSKGGYLSAHLCGRYYQVHRIIWFWMTGEWPEIIDHKDGNKQNNKWNNLRNVDYFKNCQNQRLASDNTSGITGVSFIKKHKKWRASIMYRNKRYALGEFINFDDAVKARKQAEKDFGFYQNHGLIRKKNDE